MFEHFQPYPPIIPMASCLLNLKAHMNENDILKAVKELAEKNYNKGHGWQVFIECYSDTALAAEFKDCKTVKGALAKARRLAKLRSEHASEIESTAW